MRICFVDGFHRNELQKGYQFDHLLEDKILLTSKHEVV